MTELLVLLVALAGPAVAFAPRLRTGVLLYAGQGVLLAAALLAGGLPAAGVALTLTGRGMLLPWLIWRLTPGEAGTRPAAIPTGALVAGTAAFALLQAFGPWLLEGLHSALPLAVPAAAGLMTMALWLTAAERDTLRTVLSLCLLENGVHLALAALAPHLPLSAEAGLLAVLVLAVWLLLVAARQAEVASGSRDPAGLTRLRG